jgi:hypothetical protein
MEAQRQQPVRLDGLLHEETGAGKCGPRDPLHERDRHALLGTSCIWRAVAGQGDGDFCETGFGRVNQSLGTYVVYGEIGPTDSGPISVTVCVDDIGGINIDPDLANNSRMLTVPM